MKTAILVATMVACSLSAPIVSAQEKSAPAKPAMSIDMMQMMQHHHMTEPMPVK